MTPEKKFQNAFMKIAKPLNYHRTALVNGSGYPDITGFHGEKHSLVEAKFMVLGKRGDHKIRPLFKDSQPSWYVKYFMNGGTRLFVAIKITDWDESNVRYGLWQLTKEQVLYMDDLYYSELRTSADYKEYSSCKEMIMDIETWGEKR